MIFWSNHQVVSVGKEAVSVSTGQKVCHNMTSVKSNFNQAELNLTYDLFLFTLGAFL